MLCLLFRVNTLSVVRFRVTFAVTCRGTFGACKPHARIHDRTQQHGQNTAHDCQPKSRNRGQCAGRGGLAVVVPPPLAVPMIVVIVVAMSVVVIMAMTLVGMIFRMSFRVR